MNKNKTFLISFFLVFLMIFVGVVIATISDNVISSNTVNDTLSGPKRVRWVDLDEDGDLDILVGEMNGNHIVWYENDGSESWTEHNLIYFASVNGFDVGDLDEDGDLDIMCIGGGSAGDLGWYENDGSESFTVHTINSNVGEGGWDVVMSDLDSDGDYDIIYSLIDSEGGYVRWYENDGSESFTGPQNINISSGGNTGIFPIDLDEDGDIDVVNGVYYDADLEWYENDGSESWTGHVINESAGNRPYDLYVIDLDEDGDLDIVYPASNSPILSWYENDGSESFTVHTIATHNTNFIDVGDLDEDGDLDIVAQDKTNSDTVWYENDGSESWTEHNLNESIGNEWELDMGDVDEDGDLDIVSVSFTSGELIWYEMGGFNSAPVINSNSTSPVSPVLDDFVNISINVTDGDGDNVDWCNFSVVLPDGTVEIDNVNGTNYDTDLWNSSTFTASQGGSYEWNVTCSDNQSNTVSYSSSGFSIINNSLTIDGEDINVSSPRMAEPVQPLLNFSSDLETFIWANATVYVDDVEKVASYNMTCSVLDYNSWNCTGNSWDVLHGNVSIKFLVVANSSLNETSWHNFTITEGFFSQPDNDYTISVFNSTALNHTFNISVWQEYDYEIAYNISCGFDETNISISTNQTDFNVSGTSQTNSTKTLINVTVSELVDGTYNGTCNITRKLDDEIKEINISYAKNPPMAQVRLLNSAGSECEDTYLGNCYVDDTSHDTDDTFYRTIKVENFGDYDAEQCNLYLDNDFYGESFYSFSQTGFEVAQGTNETVTITFLNVPQDTYIGSLYVKCDDASAYGYSVENEIDNRPFYRIVISEVTGTPIGGGGGGGDSRDYCDLDFDKEIILSPQQRTVKLDIINKESFTYTPLITILKGGTYFNVKTFEPIPPGEEGYVTVVLKDIDVNESVTGLFEISSTKCLPKNVDVYINPQEFLGFSLLDFNGQLFDIWLPFVGRFTVRVWTLLIICSVLSFAIVFLATKKKTNPVARVMGWMILSILMTWGVTALIVWLQGATA